MTTRASGHAVEELAAALRRRLLDGDLAPGTRLVERELTERHGVARHTLRAALRTLASEGLVEVIPNAGARVAALAREDVTGLYELRSALELEAAHLALRRDPDGLDTALREAAAGLREVCERPNPAWSDVVNGHAGVHRALVDAAASPRLAAAHAALDGEMRLFVLALRPEWSLERMADHHEALPRELAARGPVALREHLADGAATVLAALGAARVTLPGP